MTGPSQETTPRTISIDVQNVSDQELEVESDMLGDQTEWVPPAPQRGQPVVDRVAWKATGLNFGSQIEGEITLRSPMGGTITIAWDWRKGRPPGGSVTTNGTTALAASCRWRGRGTSDPTLQVLIKSATSQATWLDGDDDEGISPCD